MQQEFQSFLIDAELLILLVYLLYFKWEAHISLRELEKISFFELVEMVRFSPMICRALPQKAKMLT